MNEELKKDLSVLLSDFPINGGIIDATLIIGCSNAKDRMYIKYQTRIDINANTPRIPIEEVKSFFLKYNIRRFWFKDSVSKYFVEEDEIVAFQDGVNIILKSGSYINGGQVDYDLEKSKYKEFVYVYDPQKIYKKTDTFYLMTYGEYLLNNINQPIVRFYFSFTPNKHKVQNFLNEIRDYFNQRKIPFQFKTPYLLVDFLRSDTLVLYVAQNHYFYIREFLKELIQKEERESILEKRDSILRDSLPLFVKKISRGVGFAEDPFYTSNSFGEERCEIIYNIINELTIPVTIGNIASKLKSRGYSNGEFFRNPHTEFNYDFDYFTRANSATLLETINLETLPYLNIFKYRFLEVARDYSLELLERANWKGENDFSWFSYNEEEGDNGYKKGYYKFLDKDETKEIFWVLDRIFRVKAIREYFPKNVIRIVEDKVDKFKDDELFKGKIKIWKTTLSYSYAYIYDSLSKISLTEQFTPFINPAGKGKKSALYDGVLNFLKGFNLNDIKPEEFQNISKEEFRKNDMLGIAKKIKKKYTNINYPIPNTFGNYEYVPTSDGKLNVLMIMLFVSYPSLFDEV